MYLEKLEALIVRRLRRDIGRDGRVLQGPAVVNSADLSRGLIYVHAKEFEDFGRLTLEGIPAARHALDSGFIEERPGRIVLVVSCLTQTYGPLQKLGSIVVTSTLLALESLQKIPVTVEENGKVQLSFANISPSLNHSETSHQVTEKPYFSNVIRFHLDGFLHVTVPKRAASIRI